MALPRLRFVPWAYTSEWDVVYDQAYSKDLNQIEKAITTMKDWEALTMFHLPQGVAVTCSLLTGVVKDSFFYPEAVEHLDDKNLRLIYSSGIMRLLNVLGDDKNEDKKYSLYSTAKKVGIPDWVVSLRHKTAHGKDIPQIDILRQATKYWKVEKASMKQLNIKKPPKAVLKEKIYGLVYIYVKIQEQGAGGVKKIKNIQDEEIKEKLNGLNDLRIHQFVREARPWEAVADVQNLDMTAFEFFALPKATRLVLKYIKSYLKPSNDYLNPMDVLVDAMILDGETNDCRIKIWANMIKWFQSNKYLDNVLQSLAKKCFDDNNNNTQSKVAGKWLTEILSSILKRVKVEKLRAEFSNIKLSKSKDKIKNKLSRSENKMLMKTLLRKSLALDDSDKSIHIALFERVEKKNPGLKKALRLDSDNLLSDSSIDNLLRAASEKPNDLSTDVITILCGMSAEFEDVEQRLIELVNIRKQNGDEGKLAKTIFTASMLPDGEDIAQVFEDKCLIHDNPSDCIWRPADEYNWTGRKLGEAPWVKAGIPGPFEKLPYTGNQEPISFRLYNSE